PTSPLQVQGVGSGAQPALARRADGLARGGSVDAHGRARPAGLSRPAAEQDIAALDLDNVLARRRAC
ncbi:hypothetical protein, partial [Micrococcus sp. JV4]|uniref:hypothetical protein n=1 Tax=Micrococcus sp. JV4 TaxID=2666106 RepID=UPI00193FF453